MNTKSKFNKLNKFKNRIIEFEKFIPRTVNTKQKKKTVYNNAKKLYNKLLSIYYDDYDDITDEEKKRWVKNIILIIYF